MQAGCSLQVRPHTYLDHIAHIASALITMSLSSFHSSQPFSHLPCCNSIPKRPLQLLSYHCTARLAKFPFWNCFANDLDCPTFLQLVLVLVTVGAIYCIYKTQAAPTIKPKYWSANQPTDQTTSGNWKFAKSPITTSFLLNPLARLVFKTPHFSHLQSYLQNGKLPLFRCSQAHTIIRVSKTLSSGC